MSQPALASRKMPIAAYLLAMMWLLYGIDTFIFNINQWGILPRDIAGLPAIFVAPWLHHGLYHLISNSLPFIVLGSLVQWQNRRQFWSVTLFIMIGGGLGTWLFGSTGIHLGASGLIFGYWAYLITQAYYQRTFKSIAIALITIIFYGGMIFSLLDIRSHISWSGHAFGALAGLLAAKWLKLDPRLS